MRARLIDRARAQLQKESGRLQAIAEGRWDRSWIAPPRRSRGCCDGRTHAEIKLRDICHARSGDKGDTVNIGLVCYDAADYDWVRRHVTAEAVLAHFGRWVTGPGASATNFRGSRL